MSSSLPTGDLPSPQFSSSEADPKSTATTETVVGGQAMTLDSNVDKTTDMTVNDIDEEDNSPELIECIKTDFYIDKNSEEWVTCPEYPRGIPEWLGDEENIMKLRHQTDFFGFMTDKMTYIECMNDCASGELIPRPVHRRDVIWCLKNNVHLGPLPSPPMPDWMSPDVLQFLSRLVPAKGQPADLTNQEYVLDYFDFLKPKVRAGILTDADRLFLSYRNYEEFAPSWSGEADPAYQSYKVANYNNDEEQSES